MLPYPQNSPSGCLQRPYGLKVTRSIVVDLLGPVFGVCLRSVVVDRAAVPKTAVDKDGHTITRENDVGSTPQLLNRSSIDEIPTTSCVQKSADCELRSCIATFVGPHRRPYRRRRRPAGRLWHRDRLPRALGGSTSAFSGDPGSSTAGAGSDSRPQRAAATPPGRGTHGAGLELRCSLEKTTHARGLTCRRAVNHFAHELVQIIFRERG